MKRINWNDLSELGLMERINREILHPVGLAVSRNPVTGSSDVILVAPDRVFTYGHEYEPVSTEQFENKLEEILNGKAEEGENVT